MRTIIDTLAGHHWHASSPDGGAARFFASPCLRATVGLVLDHDGAGHEGPFAVWSISGYPPGDAEQPHWVVEFGPGTPTAIVGACVTTVAETLASGRELRPSSGGFYAEAVPPLEHGWRRWIGAVPENYSGPSIFRNAVIAPDEIMAVQHLVRGWEMSLGDFATWRMTGSSHGSTSWTVHAHASTPLPVVAAGTLAMAKLVGVEPPAGPQRRNAATASAQAGTATMPRPHRR